MSDTPLDSSKRTWIIATGCAGAVGGAAVAVPFVSTFQPSEKAKAAGAAVEVDISALRPGEKLTVEWRGKPVWIVRRTAEQVAALKKLDPQAAVLAINKLFGGEEGKEGSGPKIDAEDDYVAPDVDVTPEGVAAEAPAGDVGSAPTAAGSF